LSWSSGTFAQHKKVFDEWQPLWKRISSFHNHNSVSLPCSDILSPARCTRSDLSSKMWRYGGQSHFSTETHLASTFTSIPCTLNLRQGTPLSQIIKIISTSRILLDAMTQSLVFALDASLLLMLTALFGNCLLLPPPLESGQIIFELIAVVPIMMAAVMFSGMQIQRRVVEADPMKMKRVKGNRLLIWPSSTGSCPSLKPSTPIPIPLKHLTLYPKA